ncbi:nSTAND1 domain-containing NTPase [Actinomadura luzonensis]|uniref:nSTAND1 domain-containing NTPase n=1 Tax=Actinomadura luzonensis TaxID=2805427 RepID=UPI001F5661E5|nr:AAA family ATPase [Actinomadura luzonensis]
MIPHGTGPWVGLRPFGKDDQADFYGRGTEIDDVTGLWQGHRLTLLIGDPGVGKTSLLHAGVVPVLASNGARVLPIGDLSYRMILPAPVITARGRALFALLSSWQPEEDPARTVGLTVTEVFRRRTASAPSGRPILVAIDGAEYALRGPATSSPEHRRLREELEVALRAFPDVHLLLSLRPDCAQQARDLGRALGASTAEYVLPPLEPSSAIEALRRPPLTQHLQFDDGVPAEIVATLTVDHGPPVGPRVEPVLLQVLCAELRRGLLRGETLSAAARRVLDDVDGVLADHCTRTLFKLTSDHGLPTCEIGGWMRRTFTVAPDVNTPHRAVPALQSDRPQVITDAVVRAVENRHLLKPCRLPGGDGFQLQHPRLASALQRLGEESPALPDLHAGDLLREAEQAMSAGDLKLADKYARATLALIGRGHSEIGIAAQTILGDIAYLRAEHETALSAYEQAVARTADSRSPTVAYLFAALARVHLHRGDPTSALDQARSGRVIPAGETITLLEFGQALWHTDRHRAAIREVNAALNRDPGHVEALRIRGEIYADWDRPQQALDDLNSVAVAAPPSARAACILARSHHAPVPEHEIQELRAEGRTHGLVLLYLARSARRRGDLALAAELAGEALRATDPRLTQHHRKQAEDILSRR